VRIAAGVHEPEMRQAMGRVLKPGMNCLDIGAHIGLYTLLMGSAAKAGGGKVWSFEPFTRSLELLRKNIRENGLVKTVIQTAAACHAQSGTGQLYVPDQTDLGPVWVRLPGQGGNNPVDTVSLVRVDDVVPAEVKIDLVKMDIEGGEPFALDGMKRILQKSRPIIFSEFIPGAFGMDPQELLGRLKRANYELYELPEFLKHGGRPYEYRPGSPTTNLICLPQ
jgi:FkbM family methyltransferase